jgi:predicted dehydrogenase
VSWLHPFKEQKLIVIGSLKMACLDDIAKKLTLTDLKVDWEEGQPIPVKAEGVDVEFPSDEPLRQEVLHFLECVETRKAPRTDGASGLRVLEILHAAQRSLVTNGRAVDLAAESANARTLAHRGAGSLETDVSTDWTHVRI